MNLLQGYAGGCSGGPGSAAAGRGCGTGGRASCHSFTALVSVHASDRYSGKQLSLVVVCVQYQGALIDLCNAHAGGAQLV
jgi:hypothetical protein